MLKMFVRVLYDVEIFEKGVNLPQLEGGSVQRGTFDRNSL